MHLSRKAYPHLTLSTSNKVTKIYLNNLQSWEGDRALELHPSQLSVLLAPSETGKSTLTRFFIRFCTKSSTRIGYKDMIRKGSNFGAVVLEYENLTRTMFVMYPDTRLLAKIDERNELTSLFQDEDITESVLEEIGIIADFKNNIVLNVLSRDLPMFPIETSASYNGKVISRVLIDRKVEKALENLKLKEENIGNCLKYNSYKREQSIQACNSIKFVDLDALKECLKKAEELKPIVSMLDNISEKGKNYCKESKLLKNIVLPEISSKEISEIRTVTLGLSEITSRKYEISEEVKTNKIEMNKVVNLKKITMKLKEVLCLKKDATISNYRLETVIDIKKVISVEKLMSRLVDLQEESEKSIDQLRKTEEEKELSKRELLKYREIVKICPICGGNL